MENKIINVVDNLVPLKDYADSSTTRKELPSNIMNKMNKKKKTD
jgi:hypothetical protein